MIVKDLVPQSCFVTIATIKDASCLLKVDFFLKMNYNFIKHFPRIVLSVNYLETAEEGVIDAYLETWRSNFDNVDILISKTNRGHMFGTIDLEEDALQYVKTKYVDVKYIFKSMDDVITLEKLLEVEIAEADFYYLPGFSTESIRLAGSKERFLEVYEDFEKRLWTPQTTFFILDITKISSLYGSDVDEKYNVYMKQKETNPNLKAWEVPFDIKFDCETHLGRTTKSLKKHCLVHKEFANLVNYADAFGIWDPSHKNIFFNRVGLCHYHFHNQFVQEF